MELVEYLHVSYLPSPSTLHTFDVYIPKHLINAPNQHPKSSGLVCFIHGGAWRTQDKADYTTLARSLALSTGYSVALPNYRLTPKEPTTENALYHPAHAKDVLHFLEFVRLWHKENGGCLPREPSKLFLIGHSCSAHMLCTIFLRMPSDLNTVCPSEQLVRSTAAIIMSEGIYDIDLLLSSFPGYRTWFIEDTFAKRDTFEDVSAFSATIHPNSQHIRWFIIHSKGDIDVDERQSQGMYDFLREKSFLVSKSFDELEDAHDTILQSPQYIGMIDRYITGIGSMETD